MDSMRPLQESPPLGAAADRDRPIRVLAADDLPAWTAGLAALLRHSGFSVVAEARSGAEAVTRIRSERPDLAIMDISMPEGRVKNEQAGLQAVRTLRSEGDKTPVLILSEHFDTDAAVDFFRESHAAIGYLTKLAVRNPSVLIDALDRLHSGGLFVDSAVIEVLMRREKAKSRLSVLTARQLEVLHLMAEGQTNSGIARALSISKKAVEGHVLELNKRLASQIDFESDEVERRVAAILWYLNDRTA